VVLPVFPSHHRLKNDKDEREGRKGAVFFVFRPREDFLGHLLGWISVGLAFSAGVRWGCLGGPVWFDPLLRSRTLASGSSCRCSDRRVMRAKRATVSGRIYEVRPGKGDNKEKNALAFSTRGEVARATAESRIRGVRASTKGTTTDNRLSDRYMNQADIHKQKIISVVRRQSSAKSFGRKGRGSCSWGASGILSSWEATGYGNGESRVWNRGCWRNTTRSVWDMRGSSSDSLLCKEGEDG